MAHERLDDAELERLLAWQESDRVEFKESMKGDAAERIREAVCAFANDLPGHRAPGVAFVGIRDDRSPSLLPITDELLRQLADLRDDGNIVPPPSLTVEKRTVQGAPVAVVTVWPSDSPPVRFKGRICVRTGPRRGLATAQDERVLNERRRHHDRPFDVQPVTGATLADLDLRRFEDEYFANAVAADVRAANERTPAQRLAATKMVVTADEPAPTVLGTLVLCPRNRDFLPGAYVQFLRIAGRELSDPVADEQSIDGPVADVLRRVDEKLAAHNRTAVEFAESPLERRRSHYPQGALQQLVRNAVLHRSYEATHSPVRVTWYDDRLEIGNPGGPFGSVNALNFGKPGVADYRNPNLAEALRVMGFVQRFGMGIALARRQLQENGNPPPEFEVDDSHVHVVLRAAR